MNFRYRSRRTSYVAIAALAGLAPLAASTGALASDVGPAVMASPGARPAAASAIAGYVSFEDSPVSNLLYDSVDSSANAVTVSTTGTGQFVVTFAGLGSIAKSAVVQVSTGDGAGGCAAAGWVPAGTALQANVDCFSIFDGQPEDDGFTLVVTHPTGHPNGTFDYALNTRANSSGNLASFEYNSAHKKNSVKFLGTGKYQVLFGGPKTSGTKGVVKVTGFGDAAGYCEPASWTGSAKGELVNVQCYGAGGALADRDFIVTYATANSLMAINGQVVANAFANGKSALYQPAVQFDSVKGARVTVVHEDKGFYEVFPAGSTGDSAKFGGNIQVNAVGSRGQHCTIFGSGNGLIPVIEVQCFDVHGNEADTPFTVEWVVP